jgi:phosphopantetheine--protein transferase-like protein
VAVRVGIDLVCVEDVRSSLHVHATRWVERVFTDREVAESRAGTELSPRRLAARFAAKEAALKVLLTGDDAVPWRSIEVHAPAGEPGRLVLSGAAARVAAAAGLTDVRLDLTHTTTHAAAVVIAVSGPPERSEAPLSQVSSRKARQPMKAPVHEKIRQVIEAHGRLAAPAATLSDDADLYDAGMTSHASVNVMLALEDAFDVEFPDRMLKRSVFESVASIAAALDELAEEAA